MSPSSHRPPALMAKCFLLWLALAMALPAHIVSQISGVWKEGQPWEIDITFDAGYAVPEWRGDGQVPAPTRDWLVDQGEAGWKPLRTEAERYLREHLEIRSGGKTVPWTVNFPDFRSDPPDFPVLLNDGAYFRMRLIGAEPLQAGATLHWRDSQQPTFVLRLPGENGGYLTLVPGQSAPLPVKTAGSPTPPPVGRRPWVEAFRQGFLHVLPRGFDHILFVLGLFFYQRTWRPLLTQSLAFTLAHTVALGLAAAGFVRVPGGWIEPLIALSIAAVALENLTKWPKRPGSPARLAVVFAFGIVHGLGFAGTLSVWIQPGAGFLPSLLCANLGVEAAQAAVLAAAWILTIPLAATPLYPRVRLLACLTIAATGGVWFVERI